ncbi:ELOVL7 [Lepeophtheirus salmonis]|uniref:Elongation of very long chain fatty acids protein n=1 Tax=Lepeophtheirus salmonis TaxID=72036 RepID=A0A7R8CCM0_LEPSM|nr:ELOVL7 [Lepeophtheirus salmonis]CAF2766840.1 ELOVL7 [Lepeophtheirus salmonis]
MWEHRDKRMDGWFLLGSIWPTLIMSVAYVFMVKIFGPAYMSRKKPVDFKNFMMAYNIVQVASCGWMLRQFWIGGWGTYYNYFCQKVDLDDRPGSRAMIMATSMYWFYMSKLLDFVDTFLFVARKKNSQITTLHEDKKTFGGLLNTFIHVLMYSYYFSLRFRGLDSALSLVEEIFDSSTNGAIYTYFHKMYYYTYKKRREGGRSKAVEVTQNGKKHE